MPAYATHLLPAQLLGGAGAGLVIPSLIGAGTATLGTAQFGAGSRVLDTARQVGLVLGVAGLVAVPTGVTGDPVAVTRAGSLLRVLPFAVAGALAVLAGRSTRRAA